ncbi:DUF937 domain-containing protein [Rhizobium sp. SSA_523]|uniref:DUF937 domain-containing protein n=1 Tax=Rhizobium sp. SSA_523 TaxID=2952477 RepID=UPI00209055CA|nr:DUF937 domain-containing protein [Rhizobium sp. SSA_523]MCO5733156.1 DUF937 domain-containing protein [Rhizobium sp. SSA_523]WKC25831.1 DUF937 domain-containing protein [Rhizobium sp. SSA_523]
MLPLFDMMLKAQNGAAMDTMAKQFNLAQEQAAQAMAALMPAFSSGFKRTASNPYDFTSLMSGLFSGSYARYFEDVSKAFTPQGMADGNAVLERLFGSKEVSRAIAEQAAQLTGIGQEVLKTMMPAMADALMGGLFKQMTGQMGGQMGGQMPQNAFTPEGMNQMTQQWLQAIGFAPKPKPQPAAIPFDNPMFQAMRSMWGMGKPAPAPAAAGNPFLDNAFMDNPFTKAFQDMMSGSFASMTGAGSGAARTPDAAPQAASTGSQKPAQQAGNQAGNQAGRQANPQEASEAAEQSARPSSAATPDLAGFQAVLNTMFDSGIEVQKAYQKNMEAIFDGYRRGAATDTSGS